MVKMSTKETDWLSVGLNDRQVEESRARHGSNELTPPKRPSMWRLYLEKFQDPVIRILLVAALLSFVVAFVENEFAETIAEIRLIKVLDHGNLAEAVVPDVRTLRAVILAAVVSLFLSVMVFLLWELSCDSIWLPATLRRRYGLKDLGTVHSAGFAENVKYLLQKATERKNIGNKDTGYKSTAKVELTAMVCGILPGEDPAEVISQLRTAVTAEDVKTSEEWQFTAVPSPLLCPESAETLRGADAVILAVPAGPHLGKQLEAVLEYLAAQDCAIDGALLWNADEELIRRYYFLPGGTQE